MVAAQHDAQFNLSTPRKTFRVKGSRSAAASQHSRLRVGVVVSENDHGSSKQLLEIHMITHNPFKLFASGSI